MFWSANFFGAGGIGIMGALSAAVAAGGPRSWPPIFQLNWSFYKRI